MADTTANDAQLNGSPLDELVSHNPIRVSRKLTWGIMILVTTAVVWTYFIDLPQYAVAEGFVVPQSQIKVIQHLEGGIVQDIFVVDGDTVKEGDPLVQIDLASAGLNREELQIQLDALILTRARLAAEATGRNLELPEEEAERQPELASAEINTLESRRSELESSKTVLKQQVEQAKLAIKEFQSQQKTVQGDLDIAKKNLAISAALLVDQLVSKVDHNEKLQTVQQFQGQLDSVNIAIPKARLALEETQERLRELDFKFRREAQAQASENERKVAEIRERLSQASEQRLRTEITSPIDGIVKNMVINTIGGVVKPGEPMMEIVPTEDSVVIEVHLDPASRGNVDVGQYALVKVTSYDFIRYGGLDGQVTFVAPDSELDPEGNPFFLVKVATDKNYLGTKEGDLPISPGMQASADIETGKRSVMDYLVRPVLKIRYEAFHEK